MAGQDEPLHVFDLPQIYQKPTADELRRALSLLSTTQSGFDNDHCAVHAEGVPKYLTSIIASSLAWIKHEHDQEDLWSRASRCLAQRSGRTGMGNVTRTFIIPTTSASFDITLNEPALTGDNLGLKTWGSSFTLAKRLHLLDLVNLRNSKPSMPRILELGAGTGLLGLAAATLWSERVIVTDLPDIVPNLARNVELNASLLQTHGGQAVSAVLDWLQPTDFTVGGALREHKFETILAADPIYSPNHPEMLVNAVTTWLAAGVLSRLVLAYPIREAYKPQIMVLRALLESAGLEAEHDWEEIGRDDWNDDVTHVCTVWKWKI